MEKSKRKPNNSVACMDGLWFCLAHEAEVFNNDLLKSL
jgi:hypothetical protein